MNKKIHTLTKSLLCTSIFIFAGNSMADNYYHHSHKGKTYEVSFTNLTLGQPMARLMVASHKAGTSFFNEGEAPTEELASLAEAGNGQPMAEKLIQMPEVTTAVVGDTGTPPGGSSVVLIQAKKRDHVSIGAMLGNTNDAFVALRDMALPKKRQSVTYYLSAYDAGTETNDESCATVPGPACGGEALSPYDEGEGYVYIHNGIHGIGGMDAATYDWRSPVAKVVIKAVH